VSIRWAAAASPIKASSHTPVHKNRTNLVFAGRIRFMYDETLRRVSLDFDPPLRLSAPPCKRKSFSCLICSGELARTVTNSCTDFLTKTRVQRGQPTAATPLFRVLGDNLREFALSARRGGESSKIRMG